MYTYDCFMLRFDRKQQNSVKQLSLKKKINKRLSAEELMYSNCGAGEDSGEALGLQGHQVSQS